MKYFPKTKVTFWLVTVILISLGIKLYVTDFSNPPSEDVVGYVLRAISHSNGDFSQPDSKTLGWSLFLYPTFQLIHSATFLDYVNIARISSMIVSLISIYVMYVLARKFFLEKYSLVAASLFAFEPHLNYNSVQGLSEPLYILVFMLSFYFILNRNDRYVYLSFLLAAVLWWVRWSGAVMFIVLSIIFFVNFRHLTKIFARYGLCVAIFLIIISPMMIQRYEQYGDPLYFLITKNIFIGEYASIRAYNTQQLDYSAFDYVRDNGIGKFFDRFILTGTLNIAEQLFRISFPYLIILIPFGIIFSFRAFDQNKQFIKANWILIIVTLSLSIVTFAVIPERRFLFFIYPFLIIFATIPIQRVTEYGLSTFSFSKKQKNTFLVIVVSIAIILSGMFTLRYEVPDKDLEKEKMDFAKFLVNNYKGKILFADADLRHFSYAKINMDEQNFKSYSIKQKNWLSDPEKNLVHITIYAKSMDEFISNSKISDLKYLVVNQKSTSIWYPYLEEIYENEEKYPYLTKVFDTSSTYQIIKYRIYKIDYDKYYQNHL
ncbi:MAG: hypothetical protein WD154_01290 [Nitrosopumilaceae archaeon]